MPRPIAAESCDGHHIFSLFALLLREPLILTP
jgi:hypothetical protein